MRKKKALALLGPAVVLSVAAVVFIPQLRQVVLGMPGVAAGVWAALSGPFGTLFWWFITAGFTVFGIGVVIIFAITLFWYLTKEKKGPEAKPSPSPQEKKADKDHDQPGHNSGHDQDKKKTWVDHASTLLKGAAFLLLALAVLVWAKSCSDRGAPQPRMSSDRSQAPQAVSLPAVDPARSFDFINPADGSGMTYAIHPPEGGNGYIVVLCVLDLKDSSECQQFKAPEGLSEAQRAVALTEWLPYRRWCKKRDGRVLEFDPVTCDYNVATIVQSKGEAFPMRYWFIPRT